jgi:hypothetical protein
VRESNFKKNEEKKNLSVVLPVQESHWKTEKKNNKKIKIKIPFVVAASEEYIQKFLTFLIIIMFPTSWLSKKDMRIEWDKTHSSTTKYKMLKL